MNDILTTLSEQANELTAIEFEDASLRKFRFFREIYDENFASLLIKECADQIYLHSSPNDADGLEERAVLRGMGIAIEIIKDHFGITECNIQ